MSLYDRAVVPVQNIYREANVSNTRGSRILECLCKKGLIAPVKTPTGRKIVTPKDGACLFDELMAG